MGYWTYYLAVLALTYALHHPAVALLILVVWFSRGYLPDPVVWFRTARRMRRLRTEIELNPSNILAHRDLALIYLDRKRPRKAIALIEKTRSRMAESVRHPQGTRDDAELLFALGIARLRAGDPQGALDPLVTAVDLAADVGRGEPYMVAADALVRLGRWEEAEDAIERYLSHNQSSIQAYVKLAKVRSRQKNSAGAGDAIAKAKSTWNVLPGFKRRHEWKWYLLVLAAPVWL